MSTTHQLAVIVEEAERFRRMVDAHCDVLAALRAGQIQAGQVHSQRRDWLSDDVYDRLATLLDLRRVAELEDVGMTELRSSRAFCQMFTEPGVTSFEQVESVTGRDGGVPGGYHAEPLDAVAGSDQLGILFAGSRDAENRDGGAIFFTVALEVRPGAPGRAVRLSDVERELVPTTYQSEHPPKHVARLCFSDWNCGICSGREPARS